jgi:hypothetical protein
MRTKANVTDVPPFSGLARQSGQQVDVPHCLDRLFCARAMSIIPILIADRRTTSVPFGCWSSAVLGSTLNGVSALSLSWTLLPLLLGPLYADAEARRIEGTAASWSTFP